MVCALWQQFAAQRGRQRGDLPALIHELGLEQGVLNQPWTELSVRHAHTLARGRRRARVLLLSSTLFPEQGEAECTTQFLNSKKKINAVLDGMAFDAWGRTGLGSAPLCFGPVPHVQKLSYQEAADLVCATHRWLHMVTWLPALALGGEAQRKSSPSPNTCRKLLPILVCYKPCSRAGRPVAARDPGHLRRAQGGGAAAGRADERAGPRVRAARRARAQGLRCRAGAGTSQLCYLAVVRVGNGQIWLTVHCCWSRRGLRDPVCAPSACSRRCGAAPVTSGALALGMCV